MLINGVVKTASAYVHIYCPTGDSVLDNSPALEPILDLLDQEWHAADPNDTTTANRREQMGAVFTNPATGNTDEWMNPNQQSDGGDACNSYLGTGPGAGINPPTDYQYLVHVHPFGPFDFLPVTNCKNHDPGGQYAPAPSGADEQFIGDGIDSDEIPPGAQGIVMDSAFIYRFDRHGVIKTSFRYNAGAQCQVI